MLATIDNGGVYHSAHVIASISRTNAPRIPIKVISYPVFSSNPTINANEASQVQYAMSEDDAPYGTAPGVAMSNGQEIIAKTGTTNSAQSAFFIGAIPSQTLAVALFTNEQGQAGKANRPWTCSAGCPRAAWAAPGRRRSGTPTPRTSSSSSGSSRSPRRSSPARPGTRCRRGCGTSGRSTRGTTTARAAMAMATAATTATERRQQRQWRQQRRRQRGGGGGGGTAAAAVAGGPVNGTPVGAALGGIFIGLPCWLAADGEPAGAKAARRRADRENRG